MKLPDDFTVYVTADDLLHGIKGNCWRCPVQIALSREHPVFGDVQWNVQRINAFIAAIPFSTPIDRQSVFRHDAGDRIRRFDNGEQIPPFMVRFQRVSA